jgi:hypothetical protein
MLVSYPFDGRPEAVMDSLTVTDPDAYFARRGFSLRVERRNLDDELPKNTPSRGNTHWADLVLTRTGEVFSACYGSGMSVEEAKASARRRYIIEQGPGDESP